MTTFEELKSLHKTWCHGSHDGSIVLKAASELEALQKENSELRETIAINREAFEIGIKWQRNSALEEWFPITAEELTSLRTQNAELREALNKIASWSEGDLVTGSFDEPSAAFIARKALAAQPEAKT